MAKKEKDTVLKANFSCKCGFDEIDLNKPLGNCPDCGASLKPQMQKKEQVIVADMTEAMGSSHIAAIPKKPILDRFRPCPKCKFGYDHEKLNVCPTCDTVDTVYDSEELMGLAEIRRQHNKDLSDEVKGDGG